VDKFVKDLKDKNKKELDSKKASSDIELDKKQKEA